MYINASLCVLLFLVSHIAFLLDGIFDNRDVLVKRVLLEKQFFRWIESETLQGE
jgi:hypothetical protein